MSETMHRQSLRILSRIVPRLTKSNLPNHQAGNNHKGSHGRVGIVGGARDYAGAPYFASMSAMRLGADLAYVICSRDASQVIKNYSPDLIVTPLLDHPDENEFDKEMDCLLTRLHALVIGPGLGREALPQIRAKKLIGLAKARSIPLILDADSLILINEDKSIIRDHPKILLTPNRIELQRLLESIYVPKKFNLKEMSVEEIKDLVKKCSSDLSATILAKGLVDIVYDGCSTKPIELLNDQTTGSNRRCGGQGDITCGLAGVLIHWIEQNNKIATRDEDIIENSMAWAGYLAAIITRRCNELAHQQLGNGMLASDMVNVVHSALKSLLNEYDAINTQLDKVFKYTGLLSKDEISRYTRQMMMDEFGPLRQANLKKSSALIVGAGGLGCPAAAYLGAGGIGRLGVVDHDHVEASNLHRQILHDMNKLGMLKTESIKQAVEAINPNVQVVTHSFKLDRYNAVDLFEQYDIIIDCTDNLLSRYIISDACVVAKRPLVSGAALKMDGQLTVYNYDEETPCFRCLFPEPPPPNAVGSCSENGVMGVLPGIIGVHQALEAMKIAAGLKPAYAGKMLLYDGQMGLFRHITLGKRKKSCETCGPNSRIGRSLIDYEEFCSQMLCQGELKPDNILSEEERITVDQYSEILKSKRPHVLIDVRPKEHSDISRFEHAIQMPLMWLSKNTDTALELIKQELKDKNTQEIYVICRKGIASQRGLRILQDTLENEVSKVSMKDIIGGMTSWAHRVDPKNYACV